MSVETLTEPKPFDLLLKGGHVIDPANGRDALLDVAIADKKIAAVAANIPADSARQVVDVTGHTVTPGVLDMHTHVYTFPPAPNSYIEGMNADAHLFASGVTTTVDAGTAGVNFADFKQRCIDRARVRILAFLNIAGDGMVDRNSEQEIADLNPKITEAVAEAYGEIIVGIKTAHYWTSLPWDIMHPPWASVERAVEAGELCGKPVMVDFWPRPPERPYPDLILAKLRPGDIHTHVFAQQFPIINDQGRVYEHMFQARQRGVIFDLGHGAGSFWFRNAVPAFRGGFVPDSISTDFHMGNVNGPVLSMATTMSKYLSMGMPLAEVILRSTVTPAREIGRPELGTLSVGAEADVAAFKVLHGDFGYTDCGRARLIGHEKLECSLTIRAGQIVYDPGGLSMPEWEHAPAAYWRMPELQGVIMDIYDELGVRKVINGLATVTVLGGSLMPPEVLAAMAEAARHFVELDELQTKAGQRIAEWTHNEAAYISCGAAAGIALSTAACMAGLDADKRARLPETDGMKNEVIVHQAGIVSYAQVIRHTGAKPVLIGDERGATAEQFEAAITERTAAIFYFYKEHLMAGQVPLAEGIAIAKRHGIPLIVDAAAQIPPVENLWRFTQMGADLALFSGGKGLCGPQSSGLIVGRKGLIEAVAFNANPRMSIGRPMKVGKEEIVGLLAAVKWSLGLDHAALMRTYEAQVQTVVAAFAGLSHVTARRNFPSEAGQPMPRAEIIFDEDGLGLTRDEILQRLRQGEPSIALASAGTAGVFVNPQTLQPSQERIVCERLREIIHGSKVEG